MIEETAIVTRCDGEFAWVEAQRKTACGQCSASKGCGTSVLSKVVGKKVTSMKALNQIAAKEGDTVIIGLHESAMLTGSLAVYLIPILSMLGFAILGKTVAQQLLFDNVEVFTILAAGFGLVLAGLWLRKFTNRIQHDDRYQPVIVKRLMLPTGHILSDS